MVDDIRWILQRLDDGQPIRINCGGESYVAKDGTVWRHDAFFTGGEVAFQGIREFRAEIYATDDDPLYTTERWFLPKAPRRAAYRLPVSPGRYRVRLHFAEIAGGSLRAFDVVLEGKTVLRDYRPRQVGFATPDVHDFETEVNDGLLDIEFVHHERSRSPKISAIEVEPLD